MPELLMNDGVADHIAEQAIAEAAKEAVLAHAAPPMACTTRAQDRLERKKMAITVARDVAAAIRAGYAAYHGVREEADGE